MRILPWLAPGLLAAQMLNPAPGSWPTYNGDYSGRRFSPLSQIQASNVGSLAVNWMYRVNVGTQRGVEMAYKSNRPR